MPCQDIPPLSEVPELHGIGLGYGRITDSQLRAAAASTQHEDIWLQGNGGEASFYNQGPLEAGACSPEGKVAESLVEGWQLKRLYDGPQMFYRLDLTCNRMNFHGTPIHSCKFDLASFNTCQRISGEGTVDGYCIDDNEDRIVKINVLSCSFSDDHPYGIDHGIDYGGYSINTPVVNEKAEKLLLSFLDSKQQQDYRESGYFGYIEKDIRREWKFHFRYHYPVEFRYSDSHYECNEFIGLCIELENETPTEDILLMSFLEVLGGRGDKIIKAGKRDPQPLRDDQRLHPGDSPSFRRAMQRLTEPARRSVLAMEQFREAIRIERLRVACLPRQCGRGDKIIKAGKRDPQPLRDDQRLHWGGSPEEGVIEFSGSEADLRRLSQRWSETIERGRTTMRELGEASRRVALLTHQFPRQCISEKNRETAIEVQMRRKNGI